MAKQTKTRNTVRATGNVELRPIDGITMIDGVQRRVRIKGNEILMFKGRQIATISKRPGAAIGLLGGVQLSASEMKEVSDFVATARGGVQPETIQAQIELPYEILDDETDDEGDE